VLKFSGFFQVSLVKAVDLVMLTTSHNYHWHLLEEIELEEFVDYSSALQCFRFIVDVLYGGLFPRGEGFVYKAILGAMLWDHYRFKMFYALMVCGLVPESVKRTYVLFTRVKWAFEKYLREVS